MKQPICPLDDPRHEYSPLDGEARNEWEKRQRAADISAATARMLAEAHAEAAEVLAKNHRRQPVSKSA